MRDNRCKDCYWEEQCRRYEERIEPTKSGAFFPDEECEYFMAIDSEESDEREYDRVIRENAEAYEEFVREFHS